MKVSSKFIAATAGVVLVFGGVQVAHGTESEDCTPKDAWTEKINHPAVGTPTLTVENPDYEAGYEINHPAQYGDKHVANLYKQWTPAKGREYKESPVQSNTRGWTFVKKVYKSVKVKDAWTQVVPPVGEPTIEVENPDYVAPWTQEIEHEAVVCEVEEPPVDPEPEPTPTEDPEPEVPETPDTDSTETPDEPVVPNAPQDNPEVVEDSTTPVLVYADGTPVPSHEEAVKAANPGAVYSEVENG